MTFLFTNRKSRCSASENIDVIVPPRASRAAISDTIAPSPAPLTAPSPNLTPSGWPSVFCTVKWSALALMSGGRTATPNSRHSARYSATFSEVCDSMVSRAAMKCWG